MLWGHPFMTSTWRGSDQCGRGRGSGACGRPHRELKNVRDLCVKIEFFMKRLKKSSEILARMKYRKFSGHIPKIRKINVRRGHFLDGMWTSTRGGGQAHVDRWKGSKTRFSCGRHKWMAPF